jgi:lipopolysaccharide transport system permease protein
MAVEERIYKSTSSYSLITILKECLLGYRQSFYLARQLAIRDVNAQYRQSVLGIFWAIAPVVLNAAIWIFLNGTGTVQLPATKVPYPLFVVIGTTIWSVFVDCLLLSISSVNANKSIITKINFQKEALVTLGILKLFFNLLIKLGLVAALMIYYQVGLSLSFLAFVPLLGVIMMAFISIGILLTPIGVLYTDISRIIPIFMQILMYLSPVVYNEPKVGLMKTIMQWNPLTYLMTDIRNSLTGFGIENGPFILVFAAITIVVALFSMIVYRIAMPIITERMSA